MTHVGVVIYGKHFGAHGVKLPLYQTNHRQQHHCAQHGHEEAVQVEAGHADAAEIAHQKATDERADDADNDCDAVPELWL